MKTLSHAYIIQTLLYIDSIIQGTYMMCDKPEEQLTKLFEMIETATQNALKQAQADYQHAWVEDRLHGKPGILTPKNINRVYERLTNSYSAWLIREERRKNNCIREAQKLISKVSLSSKLEVNQ